MPIDLSLYNYILIKPNLTIDYCDVCSELDSVTYGSNSAIVTAISQVKSDYSYLGGIIPISNDQEYIINVAKVKYYEQQLTFLYLRFANDYELRIDCVSNVNALECYNVIDCIYKALNEATIYTNRVKWYVREGITDDVSMKSFSEIQTAVNYLQSHGLSENAQLIISSGTYNNFSVSGAILFKFDTNVTITGGTVIQSPTNVNKTNSVFLVKNSDNEDYYSPAIYVDNNTLLYAKMTDKVLNYYYHSETQTYNFLTYDTYLSAYEQYIESAHRQIATIGSSDNYVYLLNLALVTSHSIVSLAINISFSTGDTLAINCLSSDDAIFNDNYIGKVYTSYNILDYIATKNVLYVNPAYPSDTATQFQTIAGALSASVIGDIIYVENATHTASNLVLKDGIDIYCDDPVINCSSGVVFKDTSAVTMNIFGTSRITTTGIGIATDGLPIILTYGSEVYFEFDIINSCNAGCYIYSIVSPASLIIKGNTITSTGHGTDCDGNVTVFDIDILHINSVSDTSYPISASPFTMYFRNVQGITPTNEAGIYIEINVVLALHIVNTRLITANSTPLVIVNGTTDVSVNLWNCFFQTPQTNSIDCNNDTQIITAKNTTYANKTYATDVTVTGDFTLKPYLYLN